MTDSSLGLRQFTHADDVTPQLRHALTACWVEVTDAGGAAGVLFPPVDTARSHRLSSSAAPRGG